MAQYPKADRFCLLGAVHRFDSVFLGDQVGLDGALLISVPSGSEHAAIGTDVLTMGRLELENVECRRVDKCDGDGLGRTTPVAVVFAVVERAERR